MNKNIICFGEILWDELPDGAIPGGAPMNVAYHLNQLGLTTDLISRVGSDKKGARLIDYLLEKEISQSLIQIDEKYPTGTVKVDLDQNGHPNYTISQPVAWDYITTSDEALIAVQKANAFLFGSLAARNKVSQTSLFEFLSVANYKILDVNFRKPFFNQSIIESLLFEADMVKMNDEELAILSQWYQLKGAEKEKVKKLSNLFNIELTLITFGSKGAALYQNDQWLEQQAVKVQVQDTIGSGDAFLASFLAHYFTNVDLKKCLDYACQLGAYVATQKGATPSYIKQNVMV